MEGDEATLEHASVICVVTERVVEDVLRALEDAAQLWISQPRA